MCGPPLNKVNLTVLQMKVLPSTVTKCQVVYYSTLTLTYMPCFFFLGIHISLFYVINKKFHLA